MQKQQSGFGVLEGILILLFAIVVAALALRTWRQHQTRAQTPSPISSLVDIKNAGSTNVAGWNLQIYSDGSASLTCNTKSPRGPACHNTSYGPGTLPASALARDLTTAHLAAQYSCIRSASFGSVKTLTSKDMSSVGIDCYFAEHPDAALTQDIAPFLLKVHLS